MGFVDAELFKVVFQNLKGQQLRSFLTLLGIVIGIAAIVALISLGEGLNASVQQEFESLGTNTIIVVPGGGFAGAFFTHLENDDVDTIESVRGIDFAAAIFMDSKQVKYGRETKTILILGVDPAKIINLGAVGFLKIGEGRLINSQDSFGVVIGNKLANETFDKPIMLKSSVELLDSNISIAKLRVIGIGETSSNSFGSFFNNAIIMNSKTLEDMSSTKLFPSRIIAEAVPGENIDEVKQRVEKALEKKHGEKDFQVMTTQQIGETAGNVVGIISLVLIGIAAISLLVGGIGIMNTMLMAVMERTREIGIMKAIGATNDKILAIFLLEAGLVGMVGGGIGLVFGIGISGLISLIATAAGFSLTASVSPTLIIGALAFSLIVGILSGIVPAMRAARLEPVEALRYE